MDTILKDCGNQTLVVVVVVVVLDTAGQLNTKQLSERLTERPQSRREKVFMGEK